MRVVVIGAGNLGVTTAQLLVQGGHDVVIVESDKEKIAAISEKLDCGFIHGDATHPAILREADPSGTNLLLCLTNNDQANILASLVARSLGFARVVTKIEDVEFEHICVELGLTDTIVPDRHVAQTLADLASGMLSEDYSRFFKGEVRLFSFVAHDEDKGTVAELGLPEGTSAICIYRGDGFVLPSGETKVRKGDEVVVITDAGSVEALRERWAQPARPGSSAREGVERKP